MGDREHMGIRMVATGAAVTALGLVLAACSLIGSGAEQDERPEVEPVVEPVVTEVQLPGNYDGEGHHTAQWHLLPGNGDLPALAAAISQVMGTDDEPMAALWSAGTGEFFDEHVNVAAAGSDVQELSLGGDDSLAVLGGHRLEGPGEVAFLLVSTDRESWEEIDLGEHSGLRLSAVGGSEDLVVAVADSDDGDLQVVVVDHDEVELVTIPVSDAEEAVVRHVFVHQDRVILSGHETAAGRADVAAIWTSQSRGVEFTRTEVDDEGSVAGATRAGNRYFATGAERQGQWLRPRIWTSGDGQEWRRYTIDFYQRDLGWVDYEEDQGLTVPLAGHGGFFAALWSLGEPRVKVVFHSREERWSGVGVTGNLSDLGVRALVAPDGPDYRSLLISPEEVRETLWSEDIRDQDVAGFVPGARVHTMIAVDEGIVVSTTRPAFDEPDSGGLLRFQARESYALDGADWLPDGLAEYGATTAAIRDGTRVIAGSGGSQWDRIPLWHQAEPGVAWERSWIEIEDEQEVASEPTEYLLPSRLLATSEEWVLGGESGRSVNREGRYATIWTSPDGKDWDLDVVLPGPGGSPSFLNAICRWDEDLLALGGYTHAEGGDGLALWHRSEGDWTRVEVDDDWRGTLSYCRVEDGTLEVGAGDHWWTTTDLTVFTAGENEEPDDDESWSSATVQFEEGWAYVTGTMHGVDLMVSTEAGHWDVVPLDLDEHPTGDVAVVGQDGALLFAERDTGRAWRIAQVDELLTQRAATADIESS